MHWFAAGWILVLVAPLGVGSAAEPAPAPPPRVAAVGSFWTPKELPAPGAPVAPQPGQEPLTGQCLGLPELEELAMANNPTLARAAMQIEAARGTQIQAGLAPNPMIGYRGEEIGDEGTAGQQGMFIRQEIVSRQKRELSSWVAGHQMLQARYAYDAQVQRVRNGVRSYYYELLAAQRAIDLNRDLVHLGDEGLRAASDLFRAKEVSRVDELQARVEADSARLRLNEAQQRHQALWRQLAATLGTPEMQSCRLAGDIMELPPELNWDESLAQLLATSPELAEAAAAIQRASCYLARQTIERLPNPEVGADVRQNFADNSTTSSIEIGVPLPLFNRNQGNIYRAQALLTAAQCEQRRVALELQERLAAAFQKYATARTELEQYQRTIVPHAKTSLELVQAGYRQGEFSYLTLLTAQRTYFQANLASLESARQARSAGVQIEGLLLSGGLRGTVLETE